jgi:hypothetical protein
MANNDNSKYITEIKTEKEFNQLLKLSKAIVFIEAEWSGSARISWPIVSVALQEISVLTMPAFKLDASEEIPYFMNWLLGQKEIRPDFIYGGWGETVLIEAGNITDFIHCPAKIGSQKTKEKLKSWQ